MTWIRVQDPTKNWLKEYINRLSRKINEPTEKTEGILTYPAPGVNISKKSIVSAVSTKHRLRMKNK